MAIGLVAWFVLPDRPDTCKWLSADERGAFGPLRPGPIFRP